MKLLIAKSSNLTKCAKKLWENMTNFTLLNTPDQASSNMQK